jgi:hypothetical protein
MNDRIVTAVGAGAAVLIVYGLVFGSGSAPPVTRPLSNEAGRNGYLALGEWLASADIDVVSFRQRFEQLGDGASGLAATGNVLLTTMPYSYDVRETELQALNGWIRQGNTLLVMAALNDSPEWLPLADESSFLFDLRAVSGLDFRVYLNDGDESRTEAANFGAGQSVVFEPIAHPLLAGVAQLQGYSDDPTSKWIAVPNEPYADRPFLRLARDAATGSDAAWEIAAGEGRIIVVASASLLTNEQIANADNAVLIDNIVADHVAADGAFIFDDIHHGLTSLYDPAAFFADSRLHATIGFLIAAWFVYLLAATNRIAPVKAQAPEPSPTDLLAAVGGFMARRLGPHEAGLLMFDEWFDELRRRRGLTDSAEPPWHEIEASPALNGKLRERLRDNYDRLEQGRSVDLVSLHNLILKAREAIG